MSTNLRELAESDLETTLEGEYGLPVDLTSPDGVQDNDILGQVLYDRLKMNPDTGEPIVVPHPVITLRRSSLLRIPAANENWLIRIPKTPSLTAAKEDYVLSSDRAPEGGRSIGFIRLYLQKAEQS